MLDPVECEQARVSRNRAYDGRFTECARRACTAGQYAPCGLHADVEFFPSAAAAEVAGYRPCLRCRPETAPFSPAWRGLRTTVDRAMRLMHKGAIDKGSVQNLATRVGVGAGSPRWASTSRHCWRDVPSDRQRGSENAVKGKPQAQRQRTVQMAERKRTKPTYRPVQLNMHEETSGGNQWHSSKRSRLDSIGSR